MKQRLLYTGLLGALLLSAGANHLYAGDVGNAHVAYVPNTVPRPATPAPVTLHKLFHTPAYNVIDPINEFSGRDWNGFTPLGKTITHEIRETRQDAAAKAAAEFEETMRAGLY